MNKPNNYCQASPMMQHEPVKYTEEDEEFYRRWHNDPQSPVDKENEVDPLHFGISTVLIDTNTRKVLGPAPGIRICIHCSALFWKL